MHGRLKVRSPDAARRRQREEKLRLYRSAMATLLGKEAPPDEVLALTGAVLAANPDVGTCWNLRRRALPAQSEDWVQSELAFAGTCLAVNPKSYGAWHHRAWVLAQAPPPAPIPGERRLCERLLGADPRNFHAWEHRRALAGAEDTEAELAFAAELLARDFSNFSAWHHRGRLLGKLETGRLRHELELVQNAVFTDPNDQSAWVYLRCILSRASPSPRILCLYVNREDATLAAVFSRPVLVGSGHSTLSVTLNGSTVEGTWRSGEGWPRPGLTWLWDIPPDPSPPSKLHFRVTWELGPAHHEVTLQADEDEAWWQESIVLRELFWPEVGVTDPEVLEELVGTCRELLDLEPQSRGCLLTLVLLLSVLDPLAHEDEIRRCLRALQEADPLRGGFVADVASRAEVALGLLRAETQQGRFCLQRKALSVLALPERLALVTELDVSGNRLRALPSNLGAMRRLKVLDASHNAITSLRGFPPLPCLEELNLEGNPITLPSSLAPLAACPRLTRLRLDATAMAAHPQVASSLAHILPGVAIA